MRYPESLGIALSGLGLETCTAAALEAHGPAGCPPDSVMGHGSALGEIPFGPELVREGATVTIVRAEDQHGELALLFDAEGAPRSANQPGGMKGPALGRRNGQVKLGAARLPRWGDWARAAPTT